MYLSCDKDCSRGMGKTQWEYGVWEFCSLEVYGRGVRESSEPEVTIMFVLKSELEFPGWKINAGNSS